MYSFGGASGDIWASSFACRLPNSSLSTIFAPGSTPIEDNESKLSALMDPLLSRRRWGVIGGVSGSISLVCDIIAGGVFVVVCSSFRSMGRVGSRANDGRIDGTGAELLIGVARGSQQCFVSVTGGLLTSILESLRIML